MTQNEILLEMIKRQLSPETINSILYNCIITIAWMDTIIEDHAQELKDPMSDIIINLSNTDESISQMIYIAKKIARDVLRDGSIPIKATKDNIIFFPPWGIKQK